MNRLARCLLLVSLLASTAPAQQPAFTVASIHPSSQAVAFEHDGKTEISGDTLRMRDVTLATCIKLAWHLQDRQIDGGPDWLRSEHFDITAKADTPLDNASMKLMLQSLLTDRFHLTFHREPREMKVIILSIAKGGPKLTPAASPDAKPFRQNTASSTIAKSMPIAEFADFLSDPLQMPFIDRTGLTGKYDFTLDFTPYLPEPGKNMDGTRPDTTAILKAALHDELGLNIDPGKAPVDVLVIDHAETPSPN